MGDVFIVEDDPLAAEALSVQVEMLGYRVVGTASDELNAVDSILRWPPDVVIMDINLEGGGSGLSAAGSIRSASDVPIIFYTGHFTSDVHHHIAKMKNAWLLEKPTSEKVLAATLAQSTGHPFLQDNRLAGRQAAGLHPKRRARR
jgi:CheY-like chemotaxis protein